MLPAIFMHRGEAAAFFQLRCFIPARAVCVPELGKMIVVWYKVFYCCCVCVYSNWVFKNHALFPKTKISLQFQFYLLAPLSQLSYSKNSHQSRGDRCSPYTQTRRGLKWFSLPAESLFHPCVERAKRSGSGSLNWSSSAWVCHGPNSCAFLLCYPISSLSVSELCPSMHGVDQLLCFPTPLGKRR